MSTYEDRMAAREARKAEIAARKEAQRRADDERLDEIEIEHGDENVMAVHTIAGMVVIKRPAAAAVKRWKERMWSEGTKPGALAATKAAAAAELAATCIIHPSRDVLDGWVKEYPALLEPVGGAAVRFAGAVEDETRGK